MTKARGALLVAENRRLEAEIERLREALGRILWAENRGPDGAAESAFMVQVARDALGPGEPDYKGSDPRGSR